MSCCGGDKGSDCTCGQRAGDALNTTKEKANRTEKVNKALEICEKIHNVYCDLHDLDAIHLSVERIENILKDLK